MACGKQSLDDWSVALSAYRTGAVSAVSYTHLDVYKRQVPEEYRIMSYPQPERGEQDKAYMDAAETLQADAQAAEPQQPRPVVQQQTIPAIVVCTSGAGHFLYGAV